MYIDTEEVDRQDKHCRELLSFENNSYAMREFALTPDFSSSIQYIGSVVCPGSGEEQHHYG